MSEKDEIKTFMKKLVSIMSNVSESLVALEEKINQSNQQVAVLSKQIGDIASKLARVDMEVEDEFGKLAKGPSPTPANLAMANELKEIEKDINSIPADLMDDELQQLLKEEEKEDVKKEDAKKGESKKEKKGHS